MRAVMVRWSLIACVAGLAGCAGARAPGTLGQDATYRRELGIATYPDIQQKLGDIIRRYGYEVIRWVGPPEIYIESAWRDRFPFDDEREIGIDFARNRLILRARRVPQRTPNAVLYRVNISLENQTKSGPNGEWQTQVRTPSFLQYAAKFADELEQTVRSTVRNY